MRSALHAKNEQLDPRALNNMPQALLMFDLSARLVISYSRYTEMYGLSPLETTKQGTTFYELVKRRQQTGTFSADPETMSTI